MEIRRGHVSTPGTEEQDGPKEKAFEMDFEG